MIEKVPSFPCGSCAVAFGETCQAHVNTIMGTSREIDFRTWLEHSAGKVTCTGRPGDYSNILHLDRALRLLARLDPLHSLSPELRAYAAGKPWKASIGE